MIVGEKAFGECFFKEESCANLKISLVVDKERLEECRRGFYVSAVIGDSCR